MTSMNWVDGVIIAVIALSTLTGFFRGFVKELMSLLVLVIAIWLAYHQLSKVSELLLPYIHETMIRSVLAFVLIFVSVLIVGGLLNALLGFLLRRSGLSATDRFLGMSFGFVRGIFMVALLLLVARLTSMPYDQYIHQSKVCAWFNPVVDWMQAFTPNIMKHLPTVDKKPEMILMDNP